MQGFSINIRVQKDDEEPFTFHAEQAASNEVVPLELHKKWLKERAIEYVTIAVDKLFEESDPLNGKY